MQSQTQKKVPSIDFDQIIVRPIVTAEEQRFKNLMAKFHYLGCPAMIGETTLYIATYQDNWIALLIFSSAALKAKARDRWIGWQACFQWQRLYLIANNTRFLILPGYSIKNVASNVLGKCLKRISKDWIVFHNHPLLLVETFVDPTRFKGTCYLASGWIELGYTKGFRKNNLKYIQHNQPKKILVRPLHYRTREILRHPRLCETYQKGVLQIMFNDKQAKSLFNCIDQITDPRSFQGLRHHKLPLVAICVCATLCGAKGFASISDWASNLSQAMKRRLKIKYKNGNYIVPSKATIRRFLIAINPDELNNILSMWIQKLKDFDSPIAIDGKTMRGTSKKKREQTHVLGAVDHDSGIQLSQKKVDGKTNEIKVVIPLLDELEIKGKVITADALLTQVKIAKYIVKERKADYTFTVKDNQKTLKSDIAAIDFEKQLAGHQTVEKGHGRLEIRSIWCSTAQNDLIEFPHVAQSFFIKREVTNIKTEKTTIDTVYGVTSQSPEKASPEKVLKQNRNHWSIENKMHWVLDVTFDEDRSQIRHLNGPMVMTCLRRFAISLLRIHGKKNIAEAFRKLWAKPHLAANMVM